MRHLVNVVSVGIFLGLALFATAVLTALYASPWQAATILAVLVGIFTSVSIYFGERAHSQTLAHELSRSRAETSTLSLSLSHAQRQACELSDALARAHVQIHQYCHHVCDVPVIVLIVAAEEPEEEPPLFI